MDSIPCTLVEATTSASRGIPIDCGRIVHGRLEATWQRLDICMRQSAGEIGHKKQCCRGVVHGFGNGRFSLAAELIRRRAPRVVGSRTSAVGFNNENVFDVRRLSIGVYHRKNRCRIFGRRNKMSARGVLFHHCEVAIPAAIETQNTEKSASCFRHEFSLRSAPTGPTNLAADASSPQKGLWVGVYRSGHSLQRLGRAVSYFEWVQDRRAFSGARAK